MPVHWSHREQPWSCFELVENVPAGFLSELIVSLLLGWFVGEIFFKLSILTSLKSNKSAECK